MKYTLPNFGRDSNTAPHFKGPFGTTCGAEGTTFATWLVDGTWKRACQAHDDCYSTCGNTKRECDNEFASNGAKFCKFMLTNGSGNSVSQGAYNSAQQEAGCCNDCT